MKSDVGNRQNDTGSLCWISDESACWDWWMILTSEPTWPLSPFSPGNPGIPWKFTHSTRVALINSHHRETHLQMENQGEWIAWSPSGPGKPLNPLCPSSPLAPIMPCWPRGPGSPSMPCSMNRWVTIDFSYNWRIFYFSFWSVVTYRRSWLAHRAQNSNGSRRSLKVMGGIEQCWCHPRKLSGGYDSVTGLFILTLSPLSPLLPFWPVPPVSPCTESKAWANKFKSNQWALLSVTFWVEHLVSILSWRSRRPCSPWKSCRSWLSITPSRADRPLLSLQNKWEKYKCLVNAHKSYYSGEFFSSSSLRLLSVS